jgi:hypothetical protein
MPPGKSRQVLPDLLYRVGEDVAGWDPSLPTKASGGSMISAAGSASAGSVTSSAFFSFFYVWVSGEGEEERSATKKLLEEAGYKVESKHSPPVIRAPLPGSLTML